MSTRCHVIVEKGNNKTYLYHHCDGYPEGVGAELKDFIIHANTKVFSTIEEFCNNLIDYSDEYRIDAYCHGDEEYIYTINLDSNQLTCYDVKWFNGLDASDDNLDKYNKVFIFDFNSDKTMKDTYNNLHTMLSERVVTFKYKKANGEERIATGTLNEKYSPELSKWFNEHQDGYKSIYNDNTYIRYWDIAKNDWRTFKKENYIGIVK